MILKPKVKKLKSTTKSSKLKPKPKLKVKKKLSTNLSTLSTTDFPSWSDEELEEFIANSYSGKFHNINDRWKNFPLKPQMKEREVIDSIDRLLEVADEWRNVPAFAFDTETNTLEVLGDNKKFRLVCITVSWGEDNNYEIPLGYLRDEDIERNLFLDAVVDIIRPIFENPNVLIVGHNLKFDFHVLRRVGITVVTNKLFDTMLASWICDENTPNGLKENSAEKMSIPQTHFKEVTDNIPNEVKKAFGYKANAKVHDFGLVLIDDGEEYCIGDAFYTWCNFLGFRQEIIDEGMDKIFYVKMIPFLKVLLEMEERGTTVDVARLREMGEEMKEDLEALQYKIYELAGCVFNVGSSAQKSLILFGIDDYTVPFDEYLEKYKKKNAKRISKSGLDVKKVKKNYEDKQRDPQRCEILDCSFDFKVQGYTPSGAPSTDSDTIWKLSQMQYKNKRKQEGVEMCKAIAEYSKLEKLKTAFVDGILEQLYEDGKAHPSFNQIGCVEGSTLIPTDTGIYPIQELKENWIDGVRLESDLSVVNRYGHLEKSSHLVQFKDVPTKKITLNLGIELECSNIHPILCNMFIDKEFYNNVDGCRSKETFFSESSKSWIKAENLKVGNYVFVPTGYDVFSDTNYTFDVSCIHNSKRTNSKQCNIPSVMTKDLAEFLGIYYADGSLHDNNGSFSIRITNGNRDVVDRVTELAYKLFNIKVHKYPKGDNSMTTEIVAKNLSPIEELYEMKRGCVNKIIPKCILQSSKECIISFIRGLTLDSHIVKEGDKKTYLCITLSNRISASYLQSILFNLGIVSSITQDTFSTQNVFKVSIYNEYYIKFRDTIGFVEKEKYVDLQSNPTKNHNYLIAEKGIWVKVKNIEDSFNTVYDFSVPNTHSFISGSVISHNTDSGRLSCIAEDTLIKCVGEDKPIQNIKVGDLVYCYDDSGNLQIKKVLNVMNNGIRPCVSVNYVSQGTHDFGSLICTPDHKILNHNLEWVRADSLAHNDRVVHLRRSNCDERPRLYGFNSYCKQEQVAIKNLYFNCYDSNIAIHHKDEIKGNNLIDNLTLMPREEHTRLHSLELVKQGKIRTDQLRVEHKVLKGKEHPMYIKVSKEYLEKLVRESEGRIRDIPMDFDTFKKKCKEIGFDYRKVAGEYQTRYREVSDEDFIKAFYECKGVINAIHKKLNIGTTKVKNTIKRLDLCFNHKIDSVTFVGNRQVYDLEVEDCHNFIANEICVHNCSRPNLQQLPKADEDAKYQIRSVFIGSPYVVNKFSGVMFDVTEEEVKKYLNQPEDFEVKRKKIIAIDYHNLEMVCLTHFSHDKNLTEMFANDDDAHGSTAVNMFELDCTPTECKKKYPHLRQAAKTLNFLLMYGGGAQLLYENLKGDHFSPVDLGSKEYLEQYNCRSGKEVAQKYIDKYFESYSGVAKFISNQKKFAHKHGYVNTVLGRKRRLPDINSRDMGKSSYCERLSVNSAIQGTAGDITISAQLRIASEEALKEMLCYMLIQIHDELTFECPEEYLDEAISIIKHDMEHPFGDNSRNIAFLRADYDVGSSYQEAK